MTVDRTPRKEIPRITCWPRRNRRASVSPSCAPRSASHVGKTRFEVDGVVEDLDDPEFPPVVESSERSVVPGGSPSAFLLGPWFGAQRVNEEGASAWP